MFVTSLSTVPINIFHDLSHAKLSAHASLELRCDERFRNVIRRSQSQRIDFQCWRVMARHENDRRVPDLGRP